MRRLASVTLLLLMLPLILPAAEFDWMVREFSRQSGLQQTHIPFLGLARFAVAVTHPAGTTGLKLAVFENAHMAGANFSRLSDSVTGSAWKPMIRVRDRSGEITNIYMQPDGKHLKVIVATLSGGDATFVELRLSTDSLIRFVDEHHSHQAHP
jgi:hypothetical protein